MDIKKIFKVFLTFVALVFTVNIGVQEVLSVRVMSMNIKEGAAYAGNQSQPYSDLINQYKPDFIALQEVDYKTVRNGGKDWLNEVAMQTGMFPYFSKSMNYQGGGFGPALLSKYPFYKVEKTIFRHDQAREDRSTAWMYVQLPGGGVCLRVGTLHLSLESSQLTIQHFASINKAFFAEDELTPALMIGDYNAAPGSDAINYVKNRWQEVIPNMGSTWPSDKPTTQLDHIMGFPKMAWECTHYELIGNPKLSDHCFIVADLKLTVGNE